MTGTDIDERKGDPTLPAAQGAIGPARRPGAIRLVVASSVLLAMAIVGASVISVPYVAIRPGSARPVTEQVLVEGAPSYPPAESIAYTTVNVGRTTLLEALAGWLDDDVDVLPEQRVLGDRSQTENRRYNAELMDTSKQISITMALRHLGYEVPIRTTGAIVRQIAQDAPAHDVLEQDDVILAVDGEALDELGELGTLLQAGGPGAQHTLTLERPAGSSAKMEVSLATVASPDDPSRAVIGVVPEDRIAEFEPARTRDGRPLRVTIDSGTVGGPSAGLAFTLAVLDVLTPGELTGGRRVAVTGTMSLDGTVGPVGGGAQKAVTVRNAGYEVFLVPFAEVDEVRAAVGDDLTVIGVDTLASALDALDSLGGNAGSLVRSGDGAGP